MADAWRIVDEGWGRRAADFATLSEPANCREYSPCSTDSRSTDLIDCSMWHAAPGLPWNWQC